MEVSRRTENRDGGKEGLGSTGHPGGRGRSGKWEMGHLLDRELAALAMRMLVSVICRHTMDQAVSAIHSPKSPGEGTSCQRSAIQSWSHPSRSPCIGLAPRSQAFAAMRCRRDAAR
jgi:hypothetical protein